MNNQEAFYHFRNNEKFMTANKKPDGEKIMLQSGKCSLTEFLSLLNKQVGWGCWSLVEEATEIIRDAITESCNKLDLCSPYGLMNHLMAE